MGARAIVMTRRLAALVCVAVLGFRCTAASATATPGTVSVEFDHANKLYEQGKFPEAAALYQKLADAGAGTPSVWFNLGNAAYKSGELGRAIAAYRVAERLTPRDASLRANLQFVRGKAYSDDRAHVPAWKNVVRLATINEWTVLTLVPLWAFFSVLGCGEWTGRPYRRTAGVLLVLTLFSGAGLGAAWRDRTTPGAIVTAREAAVRFGPLDDSQSKFQLRDGAELTVLSTKGEWFEVRDPEERVGWIRRDEVTALPVPLLSNRSRENGP